MNIDSLRNLQLKINGLKVVCAETFVLTYIRDKSLPSNVLINYRKRSAALDLLVYSIPKLVDSHPGVKIVVLTDDCMSLENHLCNSSITHEVMCIPELPRKISSYFLPHPCSNVKKSVLDTLNIILEDKNLNKCIVVSTTLDMVEWYAQQISETLRTKVPDCAPTIVRLTRSETHFKNLAAKDGLRIVLLPSDRDLLEDLLLRMANLKAEFLIETGYSFEGSSYIPKSKKSIVRTTSLLKEEGKVFHLYSKSTFDLSMPEYDFPEMELQPCYGAMLACIHLSLDVDEFVWFSKSSTSLNYLYGSGLVNDKNSLCSVVQSLFSSRLSLPLGSDPVFYLYLSLEYARQHYSNRVFNQIAKIISVVSVLDKESYSVESLLYDLNSLQVQRKENDFFRLVDLFNSIYVTNNGFTRLKSFNLKFIKDQRQIELGNFVHLHRSALEKVASKYNETSLEDSGNLSDPELLKSLYYGLARQSGKVVSTQIDRIVVERLHERDLIEIKKKNAPDYAKEQAFMWLKLKKDKYSAAVYPLLYMEVDKDILCGVFGEYFKVVV